MNIALELLDGLLLLFDHGLDQIADRQHADDVAELHDGQMADTSLGHEAHAVVDGVVRRVTVCTGELMICQTGVLFDERPSRMTLRA